MDPEGFQAVDKPPLGYLAQGVLGKIFGINHFTLTLPSAIYIWVTAILIYKITKSILIPLEVEFKASSVTLLSFIAALLYIVTPVAVLHNRDNLADPLETLALVAMIYLGTKINSDPKAKYFVGLGLVTGFSFLTKVGLLLPSFMVIILLALYFSPQQRMKTFKNSVVAGLVAVAPYALYVVWYDVILKNPPRLVSGSSQLDLLLNFNTFSRLPWSDPQPTWFGFPKYKLVGLDRLFTDNFIDTWFWLAPLALIGFILLILSYRTVEIVDKKNSLKKVLLLLILTFITNFFILSYSGSKVCCTHPYYSILLIPTIAIFASIGIGLISNLLNERRKVLGGLLALSSIIVLYRLALSDSLINSIQKLLAPYGTKFWLVVVLIMVALGIVVRSKHGIKTWTVFMLTLVLTLPTTLISLASVSNPAIQTIGADQRAGRNTYFGVNLLNYKEEKVRGLVIKQLFPNGRIVENMTFTLATPSQISPTLKKIVESLPSTVPWKLVTLDSFSASLLYIATNQPVLAVGGGSGLQDVLSFKEFLQFITEEKFGYFVLDPHALCMVNPNLGASVEKGSSSALIIDWVTQYGIRASVAGELDTTLPVLFKLPVTKAEETLKTLSTYRPITGKYITGIEHCENP